jgi:hypothetical protein
VQKPPEIRGLKALTWLTRAAADDGTLLALLRAPIGPIWTDGRDIKLPAIVSSSMASRPLMLVAIVGGAMLAAALGLWAYHGTAVFFEMVRAGWIACF